MTPRDFVTATVSVVANGSEESHSIVRPLVVGEIVSVETAKVAAEAAALCAFKRLLKDDVA